MNRERMLPGDRHSFIVRIWWENRDLPGAEQQWRGMIEHVASGERRYFLDLQEIQTFIRAYLPQSSSDIETRG